MRVEDIVNIFRFIWIHIRQKALYIVHTQRYTLHNTKIYMHTQRYTCIHKDIGTV